MQINGRRLDRGVPQILLNVAQVGTVVRLVRGRGVAQPVGRHPLQYGGGDRIARSEREDNRRGLKGGRRGWQAVEGAIAGQVRHQFIPDRDLTVYTTFAENA